MAVRNRTPCRLRTTAGSGPRLQRGAGGLVRARPRQRGRAPAAAPQPPFRRQPQPRPIRPSPHPPRVRRRRRTSCCVKLRRPHPERTRSTLAVRPPRFPGMRPIGAGTPLFACSEKRSQQLNRKLKLFWTAMMCHPGLFRERVVQAARRVMRRISERWKSRMRGPQVPVPRLTTSSIPPTRKEPAR